MVLLPEPWKKYHFGGKRGTIHLVKIPMEQWYNTLWITTQKLPPQQKLLPQYGMVTSNTSECINSMIDDYRSDGCTDLLEGILQKMMEKISENRKQQTQQNTTTRTTNNNKSNNTTQQEQEQQQTQQNTTKPNNKTRTNTTKPKQEQQTTTRTTNNNKNNKTQQQEQQQQTQQQQEQQTTIFIQKHP